MTPKWLVNGMAYCWVYHINFMSPGQWITQNPWFSVTVGHQDLGQYPTYHLTSPMVHRSIQWYVENPNATIFSRHMRMCMCIHICIYIYTLYMILIYWYIDRLIYIYWLIDWLTDWLIDWLTDWFIDCVNSLRPIGFHHCKREEAERSGNHQRVIGNSWGWWVADFIILSSWLIWLC